MEHRIAEERQAEQMLAELLQMGTGDARFAARFSELKVDVVKRRGSRSGRSIRRFERGSTRTDLGGSPSHSASPRLQPPRDPPTRTEEADSHDGDRATHRSRGSHSRRTEQDQDHDHAVEAG